MRFIIQFSILFFLKINANAQVCFEVNYNFLKIAPTTGATTVQPATLYYEDGKSIFIHSKGKKEGMVYVNPDGSPADGKFSGDRLSVMGWTEDTVGVVFLKDFNKKTIDFREFFYGHAYISKEKLPLIVWEMMNEKKMISKFNCNMAKTKFRGRNYTVWYTTEIPVSDGPWKLSGLPGLILEAHEDKNEYKFVFKSITYPCKTKYAISIASVGNVVDLQTYRKADIIERDAYDRKWQSFDFGRDAKVTIPNPKRTYIETEYEQ